MDKIILKAEKREITGRKVKKLRREGILPGNIYGKKVKSIGIQIAMRDFQEVFGKAGQTGLVELHVDHEKRPVLIHNLQADPVTDKPIHADFLQVDLKEKVNATVPVELTGESPAEKGGLGTVVLQLSEIDVEALPGDLPDKFVVDISKLTEVDQAVFVKDLSYNRKKIEVKVDKEQIIVKVEPPQKEEKVPPAPTAEETVPEEEKPKEGGEKKEEETKTPEKSEGQ